jgi:hypothetical protein
MSTAVLDNYQTHVAVKQLRAAAEAVEQIKNDAPQHFPEAASVGDAARQGDIYIQKIADVDAAPVLYTTVSQPSFPFQLAEGNTKGSRHCLAHGNGVTIYSPVPANSNEMFAQLAETRGISTAAPDWPAKLREVEWEEIRAVGVERRDTLLTSDVAANMLALAGPIFRLTETNTITHPEHGDWILPPGTYRVTYQRTVTRENVIARVWD